MARSQTQKSKKDLAKGEGHLPKESAQERSPTKGYNSDILPSSSLGNNAITELIMGHENSRETTRTLHQDPGLQTGNEEEYHNSQPGKRGIVGFLERAKSLVRSMLNRDDGEPLDSQTRSTMEVQFNHDFQNIHVHTDATAQSAAQKLGAKAFTSGQHIWFGKNYGPDDSRLLSHELMHAIQQQSGRANGLEGAEKNLSLRESLEAEATAASKSNLTTPFQQSNTSFSSSPTLPSTQLGSSSVVQFDFEDDMLRELRRMPSSESDGISEQESARRASALFARRQRLRELFGRVSSREAAELHERLSTRRRGDQLSERFHSILATPTRQELLGILNDRLQTPDEETRANEGPLYGDVLDVSEAVSSLEGDPATHPNYIDNAVVSAGLENLGGRFLLYQRVENGRGVDGVPLDRNIVNLQDDPLAGEAAGAINLVYSSRTAAEAAVARIGVENMYAYYLDGGLIYPTIYSETTTPRIIDTLRQVREWEREQARAMRDFSVNLLLWYVGARLPVRTRSPSPRPTPRAAAVAATGEVAGPLGRLTQAEIQQAISASGGRTVELYTKLTQAPVAGRSISFATERALAEAARTQGRVFVVRVPDVLFRRLEMIGVLRRSQNLMGGTMGIEIRAMEQVSELLIRFLVP